jgi:hypothetical protein
MKKALAEVRYFNNGGRIVTKVKFEDDTTITV